VSADGLLIALGIFFGVVFIASGPLLLAVVDRKMPWSICRRLVSRREPISMRTSYTSGAWNPARPLGRGNRTSNEPGWATYSLTDDGLVKLELDRDDGRHEEHVGPTVQPPANWRRRKRFTVLPSVSYLVFASLGFLLGYTVTHGQHSHRLGNGALGAVAGLALSWFAVTAIIALLRARLSRRERGSSSATNGVAA